METKKLNHDFFTRIEMDEPTQLEQFIQEAKIDPTEILSPPPVCLQMENENGEFSTVGTLGNFSLVIGKAKSRKSFLIGMALSAALNNGTNINRFRGTLSPGKDDVLYFDTEQGRYYVQKAVRRICTMIGESNPANLHTYSLRKFTPKERLEMIEHIIYSNDRVGFVVIDGIKDLINSINDEAEATMLTSKLLKWTEERNIHIVAVLHQNKSDNNARGHIGTECINKAETVLTVSKSPENKDISIVTAEYCRDKEPEPFAFEIDERGIPKVCENWQMKTAKKSGSIDMDDFKPGELYSLIAKCFFKESELKYTELRIQLQLAYKSQFKKTLADNKAKLLLTHCRNIGLLIQDNLKGNYKRPDECTDEP